MLPLKYYHILSQSQATTLKHYSAEIYYVYIIIGIEGNISPSIGEALKINGAETKG